MGAKTEQTQLRRRGSGLGVPSQVDESTLRKGSFSPSLPRRTAALARLPPRRGIQYQWRLIPLMGPLGKQELVFIFILVLLLFGPRALRSLRSPQSGEHSRGIGK